METLRTNADRQPTGSGASVPGERSQDGDNARQRTSFRDGRAVGASSHRKPDAETRAAEKGE